MVGRVVGFVLLVVLASVGTYDVGPLAAGQASVLGRVAAPELRLRADARVVVDLGRESARIQYTDLYFVGQASDSVQTLEFKDVLAAHPGGVLKVCVRSRATKRGGLWVSIPRAVEEQVLIPTEPSEVYHLYCVPFTVVESPTSWSGLVEVANTGVSARVDLIRKIEVRDPAENAA